MASATNIVLPVQLRQRTTPVATTVGGEIGWRIVLRFSAIPIILLLLRVAPPPVNTVSYPLLAIYALAGRRQAILSLFLLFIFNTLNHGISPPPSLAALMRHLNIFAAAASVLMLHVGRQPRSTIPRFLWWTAGMSLLLLAHSFVFSTMPSISVLKAISFALAIQTLLVGWSSLTALDRAVLERQVLALLVAMTLLSIPLINTSIGYMRNQRGFQGVLVHPQNFGPTMAYLAAWLTASWLSTGKASLLRLGFIAVCLVLLYLSQARIAGLIYVVGLIAILTAEPLARAVNSFKAQGRLRNRRLLFAMAVVAAVGIAMAPFLIDKLDAFVRKGQESDSVVDLAYRSRGFIIDEMTTNIKAHPITGIGFGVPSSVDLDDWYGYVRDPIFNLPIMAPVEKGVLPIAMVEEMGGGLAALYFLWMAGLYLLSVQGGAVPAALCATAFATGFAEAMFFAPGGAGLQTLILATMAATASGARHRAALSAGTGGSSSKPNLGDAGDLNIGFRAVFG